MPISTHVFLLLTKTLSPATCQVGRDICLSACVFPQHEQMPCEDRSQAPCVSPSTWYLLCLGKWAVNDSWVQLYWNEKQPEWTSEKCFSRAWASGRAELLLKCGHLESVGIFRELPLPRLLLSSDKPLTLGKLYHSSWCHKRRHYLHQRVIKWAACYWQLFFSHNLSCHLMRRIFWNEVGILAWRVLLMANEINKVLLCNRSPRIYASSLKNDNLFILYRLPF